MSLRAIIIDDEQKGINTLKILIEKYIEGVKVVAEATKPLEGITLIENYKPEIVFLDINMPETNGFELLEKLNWKNFNLVFTTAHQEFGLKALKNNAVDYLLKPIDHRDLQFAINKIKNKTASDKDLFDYSDLISNIHQIQKKKIVINSRSGIEAIEPCEIVCLESMSNYTQIYLNNSEPILTTKTLKEFDLQLCLPDMNFMRVHNSYVINLHKVCRYLKDQENIVMTNNQLVPLAKSRKDDFVKWLKI